MITIETERLIGKSELEVINGKVSFFEKSIEHLDLLGIKPATGMEHGFIFYLKEQTEVMVCHIGIIYTRNRFEVSYGTEEQFRQQGYMKEALDNFVCWIFANTDELEIWGLPNGAESEHILQTCRFSSYGVYEDNKSMEWYCVKRPSKEV